MDRGATAGEREAGKAAAARVAAAAGLSLPEAMRVVEMHRPNASLGAAPGGDPRRPRGRAAYAWAQPKAKVDPITVEEILAQKQADLARKKRAAFRKDGSRHDDAGFAQWAAEAREAQAQRDREWAEQRRRREDREA